jgi:hypothetical protein
MAEPLQASQSWNQLSLRKVPGAPENDKDTAIRRPFFHLLAPYLFIV